MRLFLRSLVAVIVLATPSIAVAASASAAGNQPLASYWHPNTLLNWDPATDPDARFNRSRIPLAERVSDPALKANPNARAGEGRIASLVSFAPTSNNPSQGALDPNYYAFPYWQYIDTLVFWGGSASEGLILAPNPTVIDAAHRNGVKVYGTVFFPPAAYGGQLQWVRDFVQKSGDTYPVADKLVQVAQEYGFEGWFINQETSGGNAALATEVRNTLTYARSRGPVEFMWYDAMTESGPVSWQDGLTSANDAFLQDGGARVSDSMFLDFGWSATKQTASRTNARALGRSEFDLYAGIDTEANGYNSSVPWSSVFPDGQPHVTGLGLYRPEWTWKSSTSRADFYSRDARYWVGANSDPSNTATTSTWKGLANYVAESTPVTAKPFVTSFNAGQGDFYAIAGERLGATGWNNLSLQDIPPTYRWIVQSGGTKLTPAVTFADAYEGGSSLQLSGRLDAPNTVRLYQTRLPIEASTKLALTVRTPAPGATNLAAAVSFTDSPTTFVPLDLGSTTGASWETKTLDLSPYAGRTVAQIGLRVDAPEPVENYSIKVGRIALYDGAIDPVAAPSELTVLGQTDVTSTRKSLRLTWTPADAPVHHYDVFGRNADGTRTYLGGTTNDAYFVPRFDRPAAAVEVEAVGPEGARSAPTSTGITWSDTPIPANLALNQPATADAQCATAEGAAKAVNGSIADKWCSLGAGKWLEVDLGSPRTLSSFVVKHAGAGGETTGWNTRAFTIAVRSATTDPWQTVVTVDANTASTSTHPVSATARYVRLTVTAPTQGTDPAARIYELEAWGV